MPVTREGRFLTASPLALNDWLGRESGTGPIHVATPQIDLSAELKRGHCANPEVTDKKANSVIANKKRIRYTHDRG
jgi:hypothetical protein